MKILIIEDEILIQKSLQKLLQLKGAEVDVQDQGEKAIQMILDNHYDRILCDLMLKDLNGFDIIEESKKKYSADEISKKFIIMTAYNSAQIIDRAQNYKCPILSKPFSDINQTLEFVIKTTSGDDYAKSPE